MVTYPIVKLNIYTPKCYVEVPVVQNYRLTGANSPNEVRHLTFDISQTKLINYIYPGQSIGIIPPGHRPNGKPHKVRLYSVCSPYQGEYGYPHLVSTTVKKLIEYSSTNKITYHGVCSNYLSNCAVGDKVMMTGPSGKRFLLPKNAEKYNYIFFATGTGIAPFRSMVKELLKITPLPKIALIFGCPYYTDMLYSDFFREVEQSTTKDNFNYIPCISREDSPINGEKRYVHTALTTHWEFLKPLIIAANSLIYICGIKGMEKSIYKQLIQRGVTHYFRDISKIYSANTESDFQKIKTSNRLHTEVY